MSDLLSYEEIWAGFLAIDEILLYLHHSMWLEREYDGQSGDTKIEILRGPQQEFEDEITEHLAHHSEDYVRKLLRCPRHGELSWEPNLDMCPTSVFRTDLQPPRYAPCGTALELVRHEFGTEFVREKARLALMRRGSFVGRKSLVGHRIAMRVLRQSWPPQDAELHLHRSDLRERLRAEMMDRVDRIDTGVSLRDPARLQGRRDLYPRGETVFEKYSDYRDTRDKLVSCYHWFDGQTVNHPEFIDAGEQARGIRVFVPPVQPPVRNDHVPSIPSWDSSRRELLFGGKTCKRYRTRAVNQEKVLAAFEEEGWPSRIDDPVPPGRLKETVRQLNKHLQHIRFESDGTGVGVLWQRA